MRVPLPDASPIGRISRTVSSCLRWFGWARTCPSLGISGCWVARPAEVVTVDESGNELAREVVPSERGLVLHVVHFVDLDDGGRVTTEAFGGMRLSVPRDFTLSELREEVREFIFEDELREVDVELADEPRWEDMSSMLRERGVVADEGALLALPFVVELDDDVVAGLDG
jgi:hypothetical protein